MAKQDSRFGFGQIVGSVGVVLSGVSVTQPWLRFDLASATRTVVDRAPLSRELRAQIMATGGGTVQPAHDSPQVLALSDRLGVFTTGMDQNAWLAGAIIAAAAVALIGIVRSVFAASAWAARRNSPLLGLAAVVGLAVAAVQLWVLAPDPRSAMHPETGLWMIVAGSTCLLLGAITLGSNRRHSWSASEEFAGREHKSFEGTDHLVYSHGAWVPRSSGDRDAGDDQ